MLESNISVFFEDIEPLNFNLNLLINYSNKLIINEKGEKGELSIIFCSDEYLLKINKEHLNHNYYTDIITFDYVENNVVSGDLFISLDRVKENAMEYEVSIFKELYRVVFHGILHLLGYNDKTDAEQEEMTKKENQYLSEVDFSEIEK